MIGESMNIQKIPNLEMLDLIVEQLNNNQVVSFRVVGHSMLPFFKDQKTIVELKKEQQYKKYDVVLFKYEGQVLLHRIIKTNENEYIIRGDGSFRKEVVNASEIYGKVIDFKTNDRNIYLYILKVKVWLALFFARKFLLKFIKK